MSSARKECTSALKVATCSLESVRESGKAVADGSIEIRDWAGGIVCPVRKSFKKSKLLKNVQTWKQQN